jgi:Flp pilus assembly protein TadB
MMQLVIAIWTGLLLVAGTWLFIAGLRRRPMDRRPVRPTRSLSDRWAAITNRPAGPAGKRRDLVLLGALIAGIVVALLSGWVIMIVVLPLAAWLLPVMLTSPKDRDVALLEALDRWVRNLTTSLPTGKSIPDAIRLSGQTAPQLIAEPLATLITRLNNRWSSREALLRFADDLDSPDADNVVAALVLASERGSNGAAVTLTALADSLQAQLKGRREVETERAKPYIVVRQVTLITSGTLVLAFTFGRAFFQPYRTVTGQTVLAILIAAYLGSLLLLRRRARQRKRQRILVGVRQ